MKTFLKLFKLQIDEKYNFFKANNLKKLLWALAKYIMLLAALTIVLYIVLGRLRLLGFAVNVQLISIIILITQVVSFVFSLAGIISYLYYNKNNELLLSMPASHGQVFFSKLLIIYAQEVIVNTAYSLPLFIALGIFTSFGAGYYLFSVLLMFFLPLLPLAVAALMSVPVALLLKLLKKYSLAAIIVIVAIAAGGIFLYVQVLSVFTEFNLSGAQLDTVLGINRDIVSFGNNNIFIKIAYGMSDIKQSYWIVIYLAISAACLAVSVLPVRAFYFKAAMASGEEKREKNRPKKFKIVSPFKSLLSREFITVFRSPGNVFQYFLFALLMPIIVILYDDLLMTIVVGQTGELMINGAHVMIVAVLAMLSNIISASAISREGGCFYLIKTSPVSYYTQTAAKVAFNAIITVSAVVLTGIVTLIYMPLKSGGYQIPPYVSICTTIAVAFGALGHIMQSFDTDLKKPVLNWYDAGDIGKVSSNIAKSIIWGLALGVIMGLVIMLFSGLGLVVVPWIVLIVLSIVFCAYKTRILFLRVSYRYETLET